MSFVAFAIASLAVTAAGQPDPGITVPWEELKALYREQVEREIRDTTEPKPREPQVHSLDSATYHVLISDHGARVDVALEGVILSGSPEPIPLIGNGAVIADIGPVAGGALLHHEGGAAFLPEAGAREFRVSLAFLLRPDSENDAETISFPLPPALRNTITLELPPDFRLIQGPGLPDADGAYHLPAASRLDLRYMKRARIADASEAEVDVLVVLEADRSRLLATALLTPVRVGEQPVVLQLPEGMNWLPSTQNAGLVKQVDAQRLQVIFPPASEDGVRVHLTMPLAADKSSVAFALPFVEQNHGIQGLFAFKQPDDGQIVLAPGTSPESVPLARVGERFRALLPEGCEIYAAAPEAIIALSVAWLEAVSAPETVLDCQYLFTSFDDNGTVLSILVLNIPPRFGPRLTLAAVPDSEMWALRVNDQEKTAYTGANDTWIIPIDETGPSHVELAFLRHGPKLGLQGVLDVMVPGTGLASQDFRLAVALPPRVDLTSVEGPLSSSAPLESGIPKEFVGRPHFFSRAFYRGESMNLSLSYKEPVQVAHNENGGVQ